MTETTTTATAGFRHFHDQLGSLKEQLLAMSSKAEERTDLAVEALLPRLLDVVLHQRRAPDRQLPVHARPEDRTRRRVHYRRH